MSLAFASVLHKWIDILMAKRLTLELCWGLLLRGAISKKIQSNSAFAAPLVGFFAAFWEPWVSFSLCS